MNAAEKILIYDDTCPMCAGYTKLFVENGLIETNGRQSFSTVNKAILAQIDKDRCRNEIPLINTINNTVTYGIDAILEILGSRFPFIEIIGTIPPVNWFLKKLYNLISYNRRVITASYAINNNFDCTPDFNIKYRTLFLFLGFCFNTIMLVPEYRHVFINSSLCKANMTELQVSHLMLVMVNFILPVKLSFRQAVEFLGQVNMTALVYSLLLVPLIILNKLFDVPVFFNNACLLVVFLVVIKTYKRRMRYAGILRHWYIIIIDVIATASFVSFLAFNK